MNHFLARCEEAAQILRGTEKVTVFGHRDADGICAAIIVKEAFPRSEVTVRIIRHGTTLSQLAKESTGTFPVFVDYGSSEVDTISELFDDFLILDHHPVTGEHDRLVNPWHHGIDGTRELSGAGVAYFVARAAHERNRSLAHIALVGAMGDKLYLGGITGPTEKIVEDGRATGVVSGDEPLALTSSSFAFSDETLSLVDVAEVIDACASVNSPHVAVEMLLGDKDAYRQALGIHEDYTGRLGRQLAVIDAHRESVVEDNAQHLAYFIYCDALEPGFSGVIAEHLLDTFYDKPVVVLSNAPYGIKASARATSAHLAAGFDLGAALSEAARACDGKGGGHDVAAGAMVPRERRESFKSLATCHLFRQKRSRLKVAIEVGSTDETTAAALASSIAVDNERFRSTESYTVAAGATVYVLVSSDDVGTFKNTVDDLLACLSSGEGITSIQSKEL
jgi:single-stranded DNA-specific DHH superfamily exonuclease